MAAIQVELERLLRPPVDVLTPRALPEKFLQPGFAGGVGMNKALRVPDYLGHILQAIERIDRYTADIDEVGFLSSELVQDAVIRNIEAPA